MVREAVQGQEPEKQYGEQLMDEEPAASKVSLMFIYKVWKGDRASSPYCMIRACLTRSDKFAIESSAGALHLRRKSGGVG
jgi:hypothetical protein